MNKYESGQFLYFLPELNKSSIKFLIAITNPYAIIAKMRYFLLSSGFQLLSKKLCNYRSNTQLVLENLKKIWKINTLSTIIATSSRNFSQLCTNLPYL